MLGTFIQLYHRTTGEWVGQFKTAQDAMRFVAAKAEDMNDYEIKFEPSKYPGRIE